MKSLLLTRQSQYINKFYPEFKIKINGHYSEHQGCLNRYGKHKYIYRFVELIFNYLKNNFNHIIKTILRDAILSHYHYHGSEFDPVWFNKNSELSDIINNIIDTTDFTIHNTKTYNIVFNYIFKNIIKYLIITTQNLNKKNIRKYIMKIKKYFMNIEIEDYDKDYDENYLVDDFSLLECLQNSIFYYNNDIHYIDDMYNFSHHILDNHECYIRAIMECYDIDSE